MILYRFLYRIIFNVFIRSSLAFNNYTTTSTASRGISEGRFVQGTVGSWINELSPSYHGAYPPMRHRPGVPAYTASSVLTTSL
jgi:hypothetical protein